MLATHLRSRLPPLLLASLLACLPCSCVTFLDGKAASLEGENSQVGLSTAPVGRIQPYGQLNLMDNSTFQPWTHGRQSGVAGGMVARLQDCFFLPTSFGFGVPSGGSSFRGSHTQFATLTMLSTRGVRSTSLQGCGSLNESDVSFVLYCLPFFLSQTQESSSQVTWAAATFD